MEGSTFDKKISFLTLIYLLLIITFPFRLGLYWLQGVLILLIVFGMLFYFYFKPQIAQASIFRNPSYMLVVTLVISIGLGLIYYGGAYQQIGLIYYLSILLLTLGFLISLSYFFEGSEVVAGRAGVLIWQYRFLVLVVLAVLLRFFMIISSPNPQIDVFVILKEAPFALIQGQNPYSISYTQSYLDVTPDYFSYWPGSFLLEAPFALVFSEPRLLIIVAEVLTAFLIYKLLQERENWPHLAELVPLIFLFIPRAFFATGQAWIDPVIIALLALAAYLGDKRTKGGLSSLFLGISFAIKQSIFPVSCFAYRSAVLNLKKVVISFAVLGAILTPFFLWNPNDLINDTLGVFLRAGETRGLLMHNSLTVNSLVFNVFGFDIPLVLRILIWAGIFVLIVIKEGKGWAQFFLATSVWFFGFFLFSNQAFYNYYYFVANLLLLSLAFFAYEGKTS